MTPAAAHAAVEMYSCLQLRLKEERSRERDAIAARARRAAAAAAKSDDAGEQDEAYAEEQLSRAVSWERLLDPDWWEQWGYKVSPTFHAYFFGFPTPSAMRDYFEVFHADFVDKPGPLGLSQYELMAASLMFMRRGWEVQFIAGFIGVDRSRLGRRMTEWVHRLGAVGRMLVGVPHVE
eukprot:3013086-Prymnesium_polylepis.3